MGLIALVNFVGISESMKVNLVLTIIEVTGRRHHRHRARLRRTGARARAGGDHGALFGIIGATALGFYALLGFEDSVNLAEECEEPHRTFPRALCIGIAITGTTTG